jgi:polysaccharide biosynthesis transport protein
MDQRSISEVLWRRRVSVIIALVILSLIAIPLLRKVMRVRYVGVSHVLMVNETRDTSGASVDVPAMAESTAVLSRVAKTLKLSAQLGDLKKAISARVAPRSSIMTISSTTDEPSAAIALSNGVADEMVGYYHDISARRYDDIIRYLRSELENQGQRLTRLNAKLQEAVARDSFIGSDRALEAITTRLDDLQIERGRAYANYVSDAANATARDQNSDMARVIQGELLERDPLYNSIRNEYAKNAAQLAFERAQFTDKYPGLPGLQDRVEKERAALGQAEQRALDAPKSSSPSYAKALLDGRRLAALIAGDRARLKVLDAQIASEHMRLADLPKAGVAITTLRVERDATVTAYQALSEKLSATRADQAQAASLGTLVVIDRAVRSDPFAPSRIVIVLTALAIVGVACSAAFLVEMIERRVRSVDEVEHVYGQPVYATIGVK